MAAAAGAHATGSHSSAIQPSWTINQAPLRAPSVSPCTGLRPVIRLWLFALWLPGLLMPVAPCRAMPTPQGLGSTLAPTTIAAGTPLAQSQPAPAPEAAAGASVEPIGNVATLTGNATVTRNNAATPLKLQDDIFENDVLQTSANSKLGVTFNDATTFNLTANARITVDSYVYAEGGQKNGALFDIAKGTVAFVAAAVAKTGDMRISTPTATLGIRGTTGLVEVPGTAAAVPGVSAAGASDVAIKLYPDPDGRVGQIEVNSRDGTRLGALTQGASGFAIRPGAGGRVAAIALTISPQQAERDRGLVREVHAAQSVGRQIVNQKRIQRLQNPGRNNPSVRPAPQRPGAAPPAAKPEPGAPGNRQQQPNEPRSPTVPNRSGQQQAPAKPALPQPGLSGKPAQKPKPGAPKPKKAGKSDAHDNQDRR